ncbi:uncharacterized protein LOC100372444 [Saccoglossus kowalevskii]|uniref:Uncharacterized protein LOC100372444 n=1 Tax=Saccoglossus kowalevskii TaxID=10224 RepID=A0ABM0H032_SACKO|nr:PREDICTED: uncharacterized protein LOC100372444 [Saccoglossus kowalevskii]
MEFKPVKLFIYDISKGMARAMSQGFLGKHIEGIWHTAIVIFGREYFYGGGGIESCPPGGTILGAPDTIHDLGETQVNYSLYLDYLTALGGDTFSSEKYHLFDHNCNTFTNEVAQFLTGQCIPSQITSLPKEVLDTPLGQMIKPMIDAMQVTPVGGQPIGMPQQAAQQQETNKGTEAHGGTDPKSDARTPAAQTGHAVLPSEVYDRTAARMEAANIASQYIGDRAFSALQDDPETYRGFEVSQSSLVLFKEVDVEIQVSRLKSSLPDNFLSMEEIKWLDQITEYLLAEPRTKDRPAMESVPIIDKMLMESGLASQELVIVVDILQAMALRSELLDSLTTGHTLMKWINQVSMSSQSYCEELLLSLTRMLCNVCHCRKGFGWSTSTADWLLDSRNTCNGRIINRLLVSNLLSGSVKLCEAAASCMHNLGQYKLFDDTAVELGSALLQCLNGDLDENTSYYALSALYHCMECGEVACLTNMLGLDLGKYVNKSDRVRKVCADIDEVCKD